MADIEVHIDFAPGLKRVGTLHRSARRGAEAISFEYHATWLKDPACFSLERVHSGNPVCSDVI
jgi:serine/threonine-protein kinase HipA